MSEERHKLSVPQVTHSTVKVMKGQNSSRERIKCKIYGNLEELMLTDHLVEHHSSRLLDTVTPALIIMLPSEYHWVGYRRHHVCISLL
jgi:hypothetical protein